MVVIALDSTRFAELGHHGQGRRHQQVVAHHDGTCENGRSRSQFYADMYDDLIVFYSPFKDE